MFDLIGDERYLAQQCAAGPHDKNLLAGWAVAGLAATVVEKCYGHLELDSGWRAARVTAEFLSPAPLGEVVVDVDPVRGAWTSRWTRAIVRGGGAEIAHVTVLDLATQFGGDPTESRWVSAPPSPGWDTMAPWTDGFFAGAVAVRTPTAAEVAVAEIAHGVRAPGHALSAGIVPVNPDLTVSLSPQPSTAWFLLDVAKRWSGDGTGLAVCRLCDDGGGDFALVMIISGVRR
jgi:hypothetical protein